MNLLIAIIIIFILLVVILAVLIRFVKKIFRIVIIVSVVVLIAGSCLYIVNDANNLRKNFLKKEKLLVLDLDGEIVAAVFSRDVSVPVPVGSVNNLNLFYQDKEYDSMLDEKYKLIIFDWDAFSGLESVGEDEYIFSMSDVKTVLKAEKPRNFLVNKMVEEKSVLLKEAVELSVNNMFPSDDHLRSVIFGFMLAEFIENDSVFEEFSKGNVVIYPDSISLKLFRIVPLKWLQGFLPEK